jgi:holo-[acyl-carrier protein] synthase
MKSKNTDGYSEGIGVDIENVIRFKKLDRSKNQKFLNKIFTEKELKYCFKKQYPAEHLAVRFAGKEAVIKALNSINKSSPDYKDIEILNNKKGVPMVGINNNKFKDLQIRVSLSHCEDKAIAFAVVVGINLLINKK